MLNPTRSFNLSQLPSTTTTAIATERLCDNVNAVLATPMAFARSAARPLQCSVGRSPGLHRTSISFHPTPRLIPVPSAFAPASLAANRAAKLSPQLFFARQ